MAMRSITAVKKVVFPVDPGVDSVRKNVNNKEKVTKMFGRRDKFREQDIIAPLPQALTSFTIDSNGLYT